MKILALLDGSSCATNICHFILELSHLNPVEVTLLHCLEKEPNVQHQKDFSGAIGLGARTALLNSLSEQDISQAQTAQHKARLFLGDFQKELEKHGIENVHVTLQHGSIYQAIETMAPNVDIMIIGKSGVSTSDDAALGKNFEQIVEACLIPIVVISDNIQPISQMLLAYDGSPSADKAVEWLCKTKHITNIKCHLMMFQKPGGDGETKLQMAHQRLSQAGLSVTTSLLDGKIEDTLLQTISQENINLLVMGAYGHSKLKRIIVGSTTSAVIKRCPIPILLFHSI